MSSLIKGEDFVFFAYVSGQWKPYMCARSGAMTIETDDIETTGPGSGNYRTFEPTVHSFSATIDGVSALSVSGGLSIADLQAIQLAKTILYCRFLQTAEDGTTYVKQAYFFIKSSTETGSFDGVTTFQLELKGTGAISQVFTPPTPPSGQDMRYPAPGSTAPTTAGALTETITGLGNKYILSVFRSGIGDANIITSGTPVGRECLYETVGSDGKFTYAIPFEDGEDRVILYRGL